MKFYPKLTPYGTNTVVLLPRRPAAELPPYRFYDADGRYLGTIRAVSRVSAVNCADRSFPAWSSIGEPISASR